jgi:hypothetical protein
MLGFGIVHSVFSLDISLIIGDICLLLKILHLIKSITDINIAYYISDRFIAHIVWQA